jgi:membrane protein implicated in regulation of membrane protease activity
MDKPHWSARVALRYALLQLPGLALVIIITILARRYLDIPPLYAWGIVVLWVLKDVVLFPFVWRAYDTEAQGRAGTMIGARGVANDRLAPTGYVRVRGELWQAELMEGAQPIEKGERVRVENVRGLTLLVRPDQAKGN